MGLGLQLVLLLTVLTTGAQAQGFCESNAECSAPQVCGEDPYFHGVVRCHCPCVALNPEQCKKDDDCNIDESCIWQGAGVSENSCCAFNQKCQKQACSETWPCRGADGQVQCVAGQCREDKGFVHTTHLHLEAADLPLNLVLLVLCLVELMLLFWYNMAKRWSGYLSTCMLLNLFTSVLFALKLLPWNLYLDPLDPADQAACEHVACGGCTNILMESVLTTLSAIILCYCDHLDLLHNFLGPKRKISVRREFLLLLMQLMQVGIWLFRVADETCGAEHNGLLAAAAVLLLLQCACMSRRNSRATEEKLEAVELQSQLSVNHSCTSMTTSDASTKRMLRLQRARTFTAGENRKPPGLELEWPSHMVARARQEADITAVPAVDRTESMGSAARTESMGSTYSLTDVVSSHKHLTSGTPHLEENLHEFGRNTSRAPNGDHRWRKAASPAAGSVVPPQRRLSLEAVWNVISQNLPTPPKQVLKPPPEAPHLDSTAANRRSSRSSAVSPVGTPKSAFSMQDLTAGLTKSQLQYNTLDEGSQDESSPERSFASSFQSKASVASFNQSFSKGSPAEDPMNEGGAGSTVGNKTGHIKRNNSLIEEASHYKQGQLAELSQWMQEKSSHSFSHTKVSTQAAKYQNRKSAFRKQMANTSNGTFKASMTSLTRTGAMAAGSFKTIKQSFSATYGKGMQSEDQPALLQNAEAVAEPSAERNE